MARIGTSLFAVAALLVCLFLSCFLGSLQYRYRRYVRVLSLKRFTPVPSFIMYIPEVPVTCCLTTKTKTKTKRGQREKGDNPSKRGSSLDQTQSSEFAGQKEEGENHPGDDHGA